MFDAVNRLNMVGISSRSTAEHFIDVFFFFQLFCLADLACGSINISVFPNSPQLSLKFLLQLVLSRTGSDLTNRQLVEVLSQWASSFGWAAASPSDPG